MDLARDTEDILYLHVFDLWSNQINNPNDYHAYWAISKYNDGCKLRSYLMIKREFSDNIYYKGPEYFINLDSNKVLPLSDDAEEIISLGSYNLNIP